MTTHNLPVLRCRCCNQPMRVFMQPGCGYRADYLLCDCQNPACKLRYATMTPWQQYTMDLAAWRAAQDATWVKPDAAVMDALRMDAGLLQEAG